jgi:hypothetical protein
VLSIQRFGAALSQELKPKYFGTAEAENKEMRGEETLKKIILKG